MMTDEVDEDEDRYVWHLYVQRNGFDREFTFVSCEWFDRAYADAKAFLSKRHPNKYRDDARFGPEEHIRTSPHDPDIFIIGLKRGHYLSSTGASEW